MKHAALAGALALASALGACTDRAEPTRPSARQDPRVPGISTNRTNPVVRTGTYWHDAQTLWVLDKTPELGIAVHNPSAANLGHVRALGSRMIRTTLYWDLAENAATGHMAAFRAAAQRAAETGVETVAVVHGPPGHFGYANREQAYAAFAEFMARMARENPQVRFWELWNEQDSGFGGYTLFGHGHVSVREQGKNYARMLSLAYPAIKGANPNAWVLVGGLTGTDGFDFVRGIYEGGGKPYFDFMAIHTYGSVPFWAEVNDGVRPRGERVASLMASLGDGGRPLWNTEWGAEANAYYQPWGMPNAQGLPDGPTFDSYQAGWWMGALDEIALTDAFVKVFGYGLDAVHDNANKAVIESLAQWPAGSGHTVDDYGFGLLRRDGATRRPAYDSVVARDFNAAVNSVPQRHENVTVYAPGKDPQGGHAWARNTTPGMEGWVTIYNVPVNNLTPTVIRFGSAPPPGSGPLVTGWNLADGGTLPPDPVLSFAASDPDGLNPGSFALLLDGGAHTQNAAPPTYAADGRSLSFWSNVVNLPRGRWFTLRVRVCDQGGACTEKGGSYFISTGDDPPPPPPPPPPADVGGPEITGWSPADGSTVPRDPVLEWTATDPDGIAAASFQLTRDGTDWRHNAAPPTLSADGKSLRFWSNVVNLPIGQPFTLRVRICDNGNRCSERAATLTMP